MKQNIVELAGEIISGRGRAASHINKHHSEIIEKTGKRVIKGSLNVLLSEPILLDSDKAISFDKGRRFLWKGRLNGRKVLIYRWSDAPLHSIEILSEAHLRSELSLKDDDLVNLELDSSYVRELSALGKFIWNICWFGRRSLCYTRSDSRCIRRNLCRQFGATQS